MFHNLIESGSHRSDLARKGRFFLGTLVSYALVAAFASVAGIYAYSAHLDEQSYQVTMLPSWAVPAVAREIVQPDPPQGGRSTGEVSRRREFYVDMHTTPPSTPPISTHYNPIQPLPPGFVERGTVDSNAGAGISGPVAPGGGGAAPVVTNIRPHIVETEDVPPPATPAPTPRPHVVISQILNSKIVSKPAPPYPPIARAAHVQGTVTVEILVDEQGRVVNATAASGPAMLREAARQAALLARFTQTTLNGEPVKVSGVITYNFTLN